MRRHEVYCEWEFLKTLTNQIADQMSPEGMAEFLMGKGYLPQLYKLLFQHSDVHIDLSDESINTLLDSKNPNPYIKSLIKNGRLRPVKAEFDAINQQESTYFSTLTNPHRLFFLGRSESDCKTLEQRYGYLALSANRLDRAGFLFNLFLQPFSKKDNSLTDWSFLSRLRHPCNSMIITDNYLLSDSRLIEENLIPILNQLLPEKLDVIDFDLTLIGTDPDPKKDSPILPNCYNMLCEKLRTIFPNYKINLTIIKEKVHDRNILTNYVWINSGNSFTHFKNKQVKHDTHLLAFPITYLNQDFQAYAINSLQQSVNTTHSVLDTYNLIRLTCQEIKQQKVEKLGMVVYVCGSRLNRLLQ